MTEFIGIVKQQRLKALDGPPKLLEPKVVPHLAEGLHGTSYFFQKLTEVAYSYVNSHTSFQPHSVLRVLIPGLCEIFAYYLMAYVDNCCDG